MGCTQAKESRSETAVPTATTKDAAPKPPSLHENDQSTRRGPQRPPTDQLSKQPDSARQSASPDRLTSASSPNSAIDPGMFIQPTRAHLSERYVRERKLGSGAYGEVLLCREKVTGAERAVKIIKKSSVSAAIGTNLLEEVAVVKQLDHPNIMKLYEFFEDKKNYYLVSEVYKGGELFDEIINRQRFTGTTI